MKTVLIADDDQDLVNAISCRCHQLGLHTIRVYDAMTALTKINDERPNFVILDVDMPSGNGLSVCEMMGTNASLAETPVIILTGKADQETVKRCHSLCAYYVQKCRNVWPRIEPLLCDLIAAEGAVKVAST